MRVQGTIQLFLQGFEEFRAADGTTIDFAAPQGGGIRVIMAISQMDSANALDLTHDYSDQPVAVSGTAPGSGAVGGS